MIADEGAGLSELYFPGRQTTIDEQPFFLLDSFLSALRSWKYLLSPVSHNTLLSWVCRDNCRGRGNSPLVSTYMCSSIMQGVQCL